MNQTINEQLPNLMEYTSRTQLRQWLDENHHTAKECWVTVNRCKQPRTDCIPYVEAVEEALCFGWIDSTVKRLPDGRCVQRLSPRRNLAERGLMTEAGWQAMPE